LKAAAAAAATAAAIIGHFAVFGMVDWRQCKHFNIPTTPHTDHMETKAGRSDDHRMASTGTPIKSFIHTPCVKSLPYLRFRVFSSNFQPVTGRLQVGNAKPFPIARIESQLFPASNSRAVGE
jgi:hypothetical protein